MANSGQKQSQSKNKSKSKGDTFIWTDDEVELLLKVTTEYKVSKAAENVDWESVQSKYSDILDLFRNQYPTNTDAAAMGKDYSHNSDEVTKAALTSKRKAIRAKFRQAIDSGRKSGHGRVVLLYFELCQEIWGGSPAISAMPSGIETTEVQGNVDCDSSASPVDLDQSETSDSPGDTESVVEQSTWDQTPTVTQRRELLNSKLKGYKQEKLKRKLPVDSQMLSMTSEELEIKKKLLEKMDRIDKEHSSHMDRLMTNMERLTSSIADGFSMFRQMMQQQYPMPQHYTSAGPSYPMYSRAPVPTTTMESNTSGGQFSFTQTLFSQDENNF